MYKIYIHQRVWNTFLKESSLSNLKETGGILIGYQAEDEFVLTDVTGPGPNSIQNIFSFKRDVEYCNGVLLNKFEESNGVLTYMGEWHTHPFGRPIPSNQDNKAMFTISKTENYQNDNPVLIIVRNKNKKIRIGSFIYKNNKREEFQYVLYQ